MMNILNSKYIPIFIAAFGLLMFQACEEEESFDVEGATQNKVYINTPTWSPIDLPENSLLFNVTNTPIGSVVRNSDELEVKLAVQCTHPASGNIRVTFERDNSLILEGYNSLPEGVALNMDKSELTIPQGDLKSSDSLAISISLEDLELLEVGSYMVPIKISSVENAEMSNNLSSTFLVIETAESNTYNSPTEDDMEGSSLAEDRSAWSAELNIPTSYGSMSAMFDDSGRSYWFVNPAQECELTVDLGSNYGDISGIRIQTFSGNYSLSELTVFTSSDGENWESQGLAELSTESGYQYVKFYEPVDARYLRLNISGWTSSYVILSDFNIYTLE